MIYPDTSPTETIANGGLIRGQNFLVTGSSRGIGRTIAEYAARCGAAVVVAARDEGALDEVVRSIRDAGGRAIAVPTDVTDEQQVFSLVERIRRDLGGVDVLVNNAGRLGSINHVWDADPQQWWLDVTVNVLGVFLCCRAVLPDMVQRDSGRIINIVGGGVNSAFPNASAYGTSKAAVMRFTETLAAELDGNGVRVFALSPGLVRTEMTERFLETEHTRELMQRLVRRLERNEDVDPQRAAELVVQIAAGELDALHGRFIDAPADADRLDELKAEAEEVVEHDRRALRMQ